MSGKNFSPIPILRTAYNFSMARGWESKAVEQQQELAAQSQSSKQRLSPEELRNKHLREQLMLARLRVLQQLESAQNSRHREMLQKALEHLDHRLAQDVTAVP